MKTCDNCKHYDWDGMVGFYCKVDMEPDKETDRCQEWEYNA
jgi:hypothetical protein